MALDFAQTNLNLNAINVMEILVLMQVDRQLEKLPSNLAEYVKRVDVATYALNRLPCLYASSQEGLQHQVQRGKRKYREQIYTAVRQAMIAVQRDPLRRSTPLPLKKKLKFKSPQKRQTTSPVPANVRQLAYQAADELRQSQQLTHH